MGAAVQPFPFFGRAWQISITPQRGGQQVTLASNGSTPTLRVIFDCTTRMKVVAWEAEIKIYNLNASTQQSITSGAGLTLNPQTSNYLSPTQLLLTDTIAMGDVVTIAAGYQNNGSGGNFSPSANLIYTGNLLQAFVTRERVVDTKLTLRCIDNLALRSFGHVNTTISSGLTDRYSIDMLTQTGGINIDYIDPPSQKILENAEYGRAQTFNGRIDDAIKGICDENSLISWIGPKGLNVRCFTDTLVPTILYAPPSLSNPTNGSAPTAVLKPTIIDTPQQTQAGLVVRVLMDSEVRIGSVIQIAQGTAINGYIFPYMTLPSLPNAQGIYVVAGIRYSGDTRGSGSDWYCELTCWTPQFGVIAAALGKSQGATP